MKTVGIALGGGGAKGLAHISMLEALDQLGVRATRVAGTSIGAIMGALYASGRSAAEIREGVHALTASPRNAREWFEARRLPAWLDYLDLEVGRGSLLQVDRFLADLEQELGVERFEDLLIPLQVVAADFWARSEVVFDSGPIVPAVAASFALPGLFKPVVRDGRVLIDGGGVNPVPYDLLLDTCDIVIAVDVLGLRPRTDALIPSYSEAIFNSFQIAEQTIVNEKRKAHAPDIYVAPEITGVKVLEFHKGDAIREQARAAAESMKRQLAVLLA